MDTRDVGDDELAECSHVDTKSGLGIVPQLEELKILVRLTPAVLVLQLQ